MFPGMLTAMRHLDVASHLNGFIFSNCEMIKRIQKFGGKSKEYYFAVS